MGAFCSAATMWRVQSFEVVEGLPDGYQLELETDILGGPVKFRVVNVESNHHADNNNNSATSSSNFVEPVTVWASESFPDPFEQAKMWRQSKHELSHLVVS